MAAKLIRADNDTFILLVPLGTKLSEESRRESREAIESALPGKRLLYVWADEYIDLAHGERIVA
jgi:hypothetical protein